MVGGKILKSLPRGMKASIAFFFASVITKGLAYITTPIYTRLLSADEYGQVSVFLTWENMFGIIAMFCLSYGVFNNGMLDYQGRRDEYSFSMLILSNLITCCFLGIVLCLYPFLEQWIGLNRQLIILMGLIFLFQPAYNFWTGRQRYELRYKASTIWTIVIAIFPTLVSFVCIAAWRNNRLYGRIWGSGVTQIIIYSGFYIYLGIKSKWKIEVKYWKAAFLFNLPLIPHYLSTNLLGSADKLMISRLVSASATAYYSVAYSVASVGAIVWTAINASLIPYTYEKCKEKDYRSISTVTMPILTLFAIICIFVIMLAPEVVALMATANYLEAIYAIPPVVGGVFFQVHYFVYANIVYYYKKPKYVMYASATSMILNIILNYVCIRYFGYIAAGYTTLICYFLQACFDYFALKKVVGESVYDMRYLGILSLSVVIVVLLSNLLYGYMLIRYIIIILFLGSIFLPRKYFVKIFAMLKNRKE